MGYDRRENEHRLNRFVERFAQALEFLADELLDDVGPEEAERLLKKAEAVRGLSIPELPFLRR